MRRAVNGDGSNDSRRCRAGKHEIKYEFIIESPKPGAGGRSILYVDGQEVAEGHNTEDQAFVFSGDEARMSAWTVKPRYRTTTSKETTSSPARDPQGHDQYEAIRVECGDQKAVEDAEDEAEVIVDCFCPSWRTF